MERNEISVPEANRRFYQSMADAYDATEHCVTDSGAQRLLMNLIRTGVESIQSPNAASSDLRVLDACGGSGNAAAMMVELGLQPVVADVSAEMLSRWRQRAQPMNFSPETHEIEIEEFLRTDGREWDLIVFSSALHHIEDYRGVVRLAVAKLAPGGVLVTAFDPVSAGRFGQSVRRIDSIVHWTLHNPRVAVGLVAAKLRRHGSHAEPPIGRIAERHARKGMDDGELLRLLEKSGMSILAHQRDRQARLGMTRGLMRMTGLSGSFFIVARRDEN